MRWQTTGAGMRMEGFARSGKAGTELGFGWPSRAAAAPLPYAALPSPSPPPRPLGPPSQTITTTSISPARGQSGRRAGGRPPGRSQRVKMAPRTGGAHALRQGPGVGRLAEVLESRDLKGSSVFKQPSSAQACIKRPSSALESSTNFRRRGIGGWLGAADIQPKTLKP
jgi:hypothetical protein